MKLEKINFMFEPKHKILYCPIAKVGSTSWKTMFLQLLPAALRAEVTKDNLWWFVPQQFRVPATVTNIGQLAHTSVSFSLVRHPWERLASAYQDKFLHGNDAEQVRKGKPVYRALLKHNISFPAFAQLVLSTAAQNCANLTNCTIDEHWRPYISQCGYCDVDYSVVGRLERIAGLQLGGRTGQQNPGMGSRAANLTSQYFSQLDKVTVDMLYQLYKVDFEMFGYKNYF